MLHPLPSGAASVADWALYDLDAVRTWSLLHLNSELLASNSNVTLLASFGSPDYAVGEVESYIEFAHSLHGMYQGWQDTIRSHVGTCVSRLLRQAVAVVPRSPAGASGKAAEDPEQRAAAITELDDLVRDISAPNSSCRRSCSPATRSCCSSLAGDRHPRPRCVPISTRSSIPTAAAAGRLRPRRPRRARDPAAAPLLEVVHRRMAQAYAAETARLERERLERSRRQ